MKILILGGYGTFGGRLAYLLAKDERVSLVIAGRSLEKAKQFCDSLPSGAQKTSLVFNRDKNLEAQIREVSPDLVVDATGPFQVYGDDPYRVIKACLANAVNYMDLADGSDFVKGVAQFDREAKEKKIYILSGVSSFPVLTAAVIRKLSGGLTRINSVKAGIAPSPYAGVGLNVIRAITSYAGKQLKLRRDGKPATGYALTETMRYTICPPGYMPLRNTLFSLVDVPDLRIIPELWPELDSIWMGAGPVPEILHKMLIGLAWLVRLKLFPT
ncbi:MAG TPA: saccharopine dehydrogenase NADP-binding domain-containing protein, partial [Anaerolineales bacterium]|nr:saccharopine dehydrogenase NADP-binding domain-containing protein [Anaerolineales bacterium]